MNRRLVFWVAGLGLVVVACAGVGLLLQGRNASAVPGYANQSPDLQIAAQRADLCTSANAVGVGLRGEYFANEMWKGRSLLSRVESLIHFDAVQDWPDDLSASAPRSARWSGWIKAPLNGFYRFHAETPGQRVIIANQVVAGPQIESGVPIKLDVGRYYPILMEVERIGPETGAVRLEWTAPHGARYLVPRSLLFLPTETVEQASR